MPPARDPQAAAEGSGPTPARPFSCVLVPLDGSSFGESVLPHVRVIARVADSEVHLLSVLEPERTGATGAGSAEMRLQVVEAETYLEGVAECLRESGLEVGVEVRRGRPTEQIVRAAGELRADLVALAARLRRVDSHLVSRGVARAVMATGVASVLVARGDAGVRLPAVWREARYGTVLVPVDGSAQSARALGLAEEVAAGEDAEVVSVRIEPGDRPGGGGGSRPGARASTGARTESWTAFLERPGDGEDASDGAEETRAVRCPGIPQALGEVVGTMEPDLVVFAAHGAGEAEGPYGHCARWLLLHADAPVLVLQDRPVRPHDAGTGRPGIRRSRRAGRSRPDRRGRPGIRRGRRAGRSRPDRRGRPGVAAGPPA